MVKAREDSFHLGVKALICNPNQEILLLERNLEFNKTYWDLPGGRLQKGESLLEALKREVEEEVGLTSIDFIEPFMTVLTDIRIQVNQEEDVGLIFSIYHCRISCSFFPQLSEEHASFKWLSTCECIQKLKQYPTSFTEKLANLIDGEPSHAISEKKLM